MPILINASLWMTIKDRVENGDNVMCCFARRTGKTDLVVNLIETCLAGKRIVLVVPRKVMGEEVANRLGTKIDIHTYRSTRLAGLHDVDCVIFEEASNYVNPEDFLRTWELVSRLDCQVIFTMTPFTYDVENPHPLKELWDTAPYFKFQLGPAKSKHYKTIKEQHLEDSFTPEAFQTEVLGNWVARIGK